MRPPAVPLLACALLLAGCAAPGAPAVTVPPATAAPPAVTPAASLPVPSTPADAPPASPAPTAPAAPPEPVALPDADRTFELRLPERDGTHHGFLVNATDRALVTLYVRNAEPVSRDFGATVLATVPNGTQQQDSGLLPDGGAAFVLRLASFGLSAEDGPALVRVRVSATVPVVVEGRIDVDDEVSEEGGSTVP